MAKLEASTVRCRRQLPIPSRIAWRDSFAPCRKNSDIGHNAEDHRAQPPARQETGQDDGDDQADDERIDGNAKLRSENSWHETQPVVLAKPMSNPGRIVQRPDPCDEK
jgi:hypothetical protein